MVIVKFVAVGVALAASVLSLMKLQSMIFDLNYCKQIELILAAYQIAVDSTIGFLDPIARIILNTLGGLIAVPIELAGDWKHVFCVAGLYFFREAGVAFGAKQRWTALFLFFLGGWLCLVLSVAVSAMPLEPRESANSIRVMLSFVAVLMFYELGASAWKAAAFRSENDGTYFGRLGKRAFYVTRRAVVGAVFCVSLFYGLSILAPDQSARHITWVVIFAFIFGLSMEWIRVGLVELQRRKTQLMGSADGSAKIRGLLSVNTARVGVLMAGVMSASILFAILLVR